MHAGVNEAFMRFQHCCTLRDMKDFNFIIFLNTEKCISPIQNIECLIESERSFVTVHTIDGVKIPP